VPGIEQQCTDKEGPDRGNIGWLVAKGDVMKGIGSGTLAGSTCIDDGGHIANI
jgi:hypothetical protein